MRTTSRFLVAYLPGLTAALAACGAGTLPTRYVDRPLLVPEDEHRLALSVPLGYSGDVLPFEAGWRFGIAPEVAWEAPLMLALAPIEPTALPFVARFGIAGFGVREDEVPQSDPRSPPEKRTLGVTILRLGLAGRMPLTRSHVLLPTANLDHTLRPHQDNTAADFALTWLTSPREWLSFGPGLHLIEGVDSPFDGGLRTRRLTVGHVGTDGGLPFSLVAFHAAKILDVGLGAALSWNLRDRTEWDADAAVNLEFHWD